MIIIPFYCTDILTVILLIMALLGTLITILHHRASRNLHLTSEPGTLAAAIALAGMSDLAHILDGKDTLEDMHTILADLHFALDPVSFQHSLISFASIPLVLSLITLHALALLRYSILLHRSRAEYG